MFTIREANAEDAFALGPQLAALDQTEVSMHTEDMVEGLLLPFLHGGRVWAADHEGEVCALFGYYQTGPNARYVWYLSSTVPYQFPLSAKRAILTVLDQWQMDTPVLYSMCYDDPHRLRLLRILGFDIGQAFEHSSGHPMRNIYRIRKRGPRASASTR